MKKGKIIVIEGTDCSGKETQSKLLLERLRQNGINVERISFPCYDTPTGKIIAGALLGKKNFSESFFEEGLPDVDPKLISLYYAADRQYNIAKVLELLDNGTNVILDRYVYSNMAFQGAKFKDDINKLQFFEWVEKLEFELLELPKSDINIFLHMSVSKTMEFLNKRGEVADENEKNPNYLKKCEQTYLLLAGKYQFKTIECEKDNNIRSIESINDELYTYVFNALK